MRRRRMLLLAGCVALLAATDAGIVFAQAVYVADSSSGQITVFDPTGAPRSFVGNTDALLTPLGIALDGTGALVVADNQRNRILRYDAAGDGPLVLASRIAAPDGPSFGPGGDLFFVSSPAGIRKARGVYVIPGGAGPRTLIATIPRSEMLRETAVVPAGPFAGHLLVLSEKPAFIARFAPDGSGGWTRESDFVAALPGTGTGMDFTTSGELLVSGTQGTLRSPDVPGRRLPGYEEAEPGTGTGTGPGTTEPALLGTEGVVWRFDETGNQLTDFAAGMSVGSTRLAIGADSTVYVTNRNGPSVVRFNSFGARLADVAAGLQSPAGIATQALVPTPVGTNVTVELLTGLRVVFDRVITAGFTSAEQSLLSFEDRVTPCGNELPSFILPPSTGPFFVTRIQTTAIHTDTIEVIQDHPAGDSRLFHVECGSDSEGDFTDTTTLAVPGDPRGRTINFSEFVVGTDARDNGQIIALKLMSLESLAGIDSGVEECIDPQTLATLRDSLSRIHSLALADNTQLAVDELQALKTFVRQRSGPDGIPNFGPTACGNIAGGMVAIASTAIFSLSLYLPQ